MANLSTNSTTTLFLSDVWKRREESLLLQSPKYYFSTLKGIRAAFLRSGIWSDIEPWPETTAREQIIGELKKQKCDWIVHRKLLPEDKPKNIPSLFVFNYSESPFINLTQPLSVKKEVLSHIRRTERKITREIGSLSIELANNDNKNEWFKIWLEFQNKINRFTDQNVQDLSKWLLEGDLPDWTKLITLKAGNITIAMGIFYIWNDVFYYYSPVMNPDENLRKYGPGKLFVDYLIQYAKENGCKKFDFLQGEHSYKWHWNPSTQTLQQCIIPLTSKGYAMFALFKIKKFIQSFLGRGQSI